MTPATRQAKIADIIRQQKRVTVNKLAESLDISRETIRRDLTALAKSGKIQKFHGGATLGSTFEEGPFNERMGENVASKTAIAQMAPKIISPGETILIDTGSTSVYFAEKLAEIPNLTVITNSSEIARIISSSHNGSTVYLLGGQYNSCNRQTVGNLVVSQIQLFRAHHAILTVGAIDGQTGIMDYSIEEAQIAQSMIGQAGSLTIIADSTKFDRIASFKVCGLEQINCLISEELPPKHIKYFLDQAKVTTVTA